MVSLRGNLNKGIPGLLSTHSWGTGKSGIFLLSLWLLLCLWVSSHPDVPQVPVPFIIKRVGISQPLVSGSAAAPQAACTECVPQQLGTRTFGALKWVWSHPGDANQFYLHHNSSDGAVYSKLRKGPLSCPCWGPGLAPSRSLPCFPHHRSVHVCKGFVNSAQGSRDVVILEIIPFLLLQGRQNALNSSLHGKSMPGFPDLSTGKAPTWSVPENNHLWMNNTLFPHSIICCHALHSPQGKNYPQLQVGQTTTDFVLTQAGASRIFLVVSAPCEQLNWAG